MFCIDIAYSKPGQNTPDIYITLQLNNNIDVSVSLLIYAQKQLLGGWRSLEGGLVQKALRDPTKAAHRQALLKVLSQALGIAGGGGGQKFDPQALREMEVGLQLHILTPLF